MATTIPDHEFATIFPLIVGEAFRRFGFAAALKPVHTAEAMATKE